MNLENMMLSEMTQRTNMWFHLYEVPQIGKVIETESRIVVIRG